MQSNEIMLVRTIEPYQNVVHLEKKVPQDTSTLGKHIEQVKDINSRKHELH